MSLLPAFQEGSKNLHSLLDTLAESQLKARGRDSTNHEKSIILAGLRRALSMAAAKAYCFCLLGVQGRGGAQAGSQNEGPG